MRGLRKFDERCELVLPSMSCLPSRKYNEGISGASLTYLQRSRHEVSFTPFIAVASLSSRDSPQSEVNQASRRNEAPMSLGPLLLQPTARFTSLPRHGSTVDRTARVRMVGEYSVTAYTPFGRRGRGPADTALSSPPSCAAQAEPIAPPTLLSTASASILSM